jgi:hypothetical protein
MALGKMLAKAAVKANKNAGGIAAAGAVAGAGGAAVKKNADAKKAKPAAKAAPKKFNVGGMLSGNTGAVMPPAKQNQDADVAAKAGAQAKRNFMQTTMPRPPKARGPFELNKGGSVPKKFNSGGDVKGGLRSSTIMSNALQKRMEEAGVNEPVLTKAKAASAPETGQYNGKKFQMSAERKAKQEEERKRLMKKHFRNED